jgi:hypothetical protein
VLRTVPFLIATSANLAPRALPVADTAGPAVDLLGLATALLIAAGFAAVCLALSAMTRTRLETQLGQEYRALLERLPFEAWLGPRVPMADAGIEPGSAVPPDKSELRHLLQDVFRSPWAWPSPRQRPIDGESLRLAYRYFDLCNHQTLLHRQGRISDRTWEAWSAGIRSNLERPWFRDRYRMIIESRDAVDDGAGRHFTGLAELIGDLPEAAPG